MHDATIVLKDGKKLISPIWCWRPTEGWFELIDEGRIRFDDVLSAEEVIRTHPGVEERVDLLERARQQGWIPKP